MSGGEQTTETVRQWAIESEEGTRSFTSQHVAETIAGGAQGWTLNHVPVVAAFTRASPLSDWVRLGPDRTLVKCRGCRIQDCEIEGNTAAPCTCKPPAVHGDDE